MCGIVGKIKSDPLETVDPRAIQAMLESIAHRGPDGQGIHLDRNAGLGHARLSIIDLETGRQPMTNEDGTLWIVFNGEIYNYRDLRTRLMAQGHIFRSQSDTEVIIHLYEEMGAECVRDLRGMFAFAIWDTRRRKLFVARDRVGIKPLYYRQTAESFSFASEMKALILDPDAPRTINQNALRNFFAYNYIPGEETLLEGVMKLAPGTHLTWEAGRIERRQYWDLKFSRDRWNLGWPEAVEELRALLSRTVGDHMIADVPVGVLLSGGVDSSALASFAARASNKQIKTFTIGFAGGGVVDERPFARLAANKIGAEHHEATSSADDFWNFLPDFVRHMEESVCEPPAVALHYVSRLARGHVKVLLSGEGGDEAFAGYPNYPNRLRLQQLGALAGPFARPMGMAAAFAGRLSREARLETYGEALGRPLASNYFSRSSGPTAFFNRQAREFFSGDFLKQTCSHSPASAMACLTGMVPDEGLLDQMLYVDTKTWLPDDLLVKADKITMANSLELRVPFLDHEVLEFAASLPAHFKVRGGETKRILKAAFARELPPETLRRKKAGFPVPYANWLRGELSGRVAEVLLSDSAASRGYFKRSAVSRLLKANQVSGGLSKEVFSLLVVELWHREFMDNRPRCEVR